MTNEEKLSDVVDEYLHWRKVNPHIKGGENYLRRLQDATSKAQPLAVKTQKCQNGMHDFRPGLVFNYCNNCEEFY